MAHFLQCTHLVSVQLVEIIETAKLYSHAQQFLNWFEWHLVNGEGKTIQSNILTSPNNRDSGPPRSSTSLPAGIAMHCQIGALLSLFTVCVQQIKEMHMNINKSNIYRYEVLIDCNTKKSRLSGYWIYWQFKGCVSPQVEMKFKLLLDIGRGSEEPNENSNRLMPIIIYRHNIRLSTYYPHKQAITSR